MDDLWPAESPATILIPPPETMRQVETPEQRFDRVVASAEARLVASKAVQRRADAAIEQASVYLATFYEN